MSTATRTACAVCLVVSATQLLAAPARLVSVATTTSITIDGLLDEWPQLAALDETHLSIGARNDERNLYLMIATSDQTRRQQLIAAGLIVWFDQDGGKKRAFGIRIPGGLPGDSGPGAFRGPRRGSAAPQDPDAASALVLPPLTHFEIVGPGDDERRRVELGATRSIQIARELREGTLTVELQIPLARNDAAAYAIGTAAGRVIGLGLETPKLERPEVPAESRGDGRPSGGRGGGPGGGGGAGGGMRGGGSGGPPPAGGGDPGDRPRRPDPLKYWTTLQLVSR